jgi:hypothetical protein
MRSKKNGLLCADRENIRKVSVRLKLTRGAYKKKEPAPHCPELEAPCGCGVKSGADLPLDFKLTRRSFLAHVRHVSDSRVKGAYRDRLMLLANAELKRKPTLSEDFERKYRREIFKIILSKAQTQTNLNPVHMRIKLSTYKYAEK